MTRDNLKFASSNKYEVGSAPPTGYVQWHEWAAAQHKGGLRQRQCRTCGLWKFPQEMAAHNNLQGLPCP